MEVVFRSVRRWAPWRRALAIKMLGFTGAEEAVPVLIQRLSDRSPYVREAAVRALGRIGDTRALPALEQLYVEPGRVAAGILYEALLAFGPHSAQVFSDGGTGVRPGRRCGGRAGERHRVRPPLERLVGPGDRRMADPLQVAGVIVRLANVLAVGRVTGVPPAADLDVDLSVVVDRIVDPSEKAKDHVRIAIVQRQSSSKL
jgi:hypothetical protein